MKIFFYLLSLATILVQPFTSKGQFSREEAIDLVQNQILANENPNLYVSYNIIPSSPKIVLSNGQKIQPPYQGNWVFFSDDKPFANWDHSCRYIFVDSSTGDYTISASTSYPIDLQQFYQTLSLVNYPCPADCYHSDTTQPSFTFHSLPSNTNPHLHAVLINGIDRFIPGANSCTCNFDYDIAMMYNALEEIGYTTHFNPPPPSGYPPNESNVIVLYDNGGTNAGKTVFHNDWDGPCECSYPNNGSCTACSTYRDEVDFAATDVNIYQVFDTLANDMNKKLFSQDQLFIYITGNGSMQNGQPAFECYHDTNTPAVYITASQLRDAIKNINCAQIIIVLQFNYSGKFINFLTDITNAQCKNILVFTSTGDGSIEYPSTDSYKEIWMHCSNIDEFTYYFSSALRGHYPSRFPWDWLCPTGEFQFNDTIYGPDWINDGCVSATHPLDYNPDSGTPPYPNIIPGNNDGYIQLIEAFNYTKCMDTWCKDGYKNQRKFMQLPNPNPPPPDTIWNTNVYCNNDYETPMMGVSDGFSLYNSMCLNGIAGTIYANEGDQTINGYRSYLLGGNLTIQPDMTIEANAEVTIGVDSTYIDFGPNSDVTINQGFQLNGADTSSCLSTQYLRIQNHNNLLDLRDVNFKSVNLLFFGDNMNITSTNPQYPVTTFINCPKIGSERGQVNITYSNFLDSRVYLDNIDYDSLNAIDYSNALATINNCVFTNTETSPVQYNIYSEYRFKYQFTNNQIDGGAHGIGLFWSGSTAINSKIENNTITNCSEGGIRVYNSEAYIHNNKISNCNKGLIICNHKSNVSICGDYYAQDEDHKQNIMNCSSYEIFASNNTFPYYMKYNRIIDEDRQFGDPLLYYYNQNPGVFNVAENCWGCCFNYHNDLKLYIEGTFITDPLWCLPRKSCPCPSG